MSMFTNYYPDRESIRALLFDTHGTGLLFHGVQRGKLRPFYTTFGGGVEANETPQETLHRELYEELDAEAKIGRREVIALTGHHYYVARLIKRGDQPFTHGPEYQERKDQKFTVKKVSYAHASAREFNLQPDLLKKFLKDYGKIVLKELADLD